MQPIRRTLNEQRALVMSRWQETREDAGEVVGGAAGITKTAHNEVSWITRHGATDVKHWMLHETEIVTCRWLDFGQSKRLTLNTGGFRGMTTKRHINHILSELHVDARLVSHRGRWVVRRGYEPVSVSMPFVDGVQLHVHADAIDVHYSPEQRRALVDLDDAVAAINKYCRYALRVFKEEGIPAPAPGDCWICCAGSDLSCLWSHVAELYVHGSLLAQVLRHRGVLNAFATNVYYGWKTVVDQSGRTTLVSGGPGAGSPSFAARMLRSFLRSKLLGSGSVIPSKADLEKMVQ